MVIKFFLTFCGGLLASALALVSFVKNFAPGFSINSKKSILYGILLAAVSGAVAFLCTYLFSNNLLWIYWVFIAIFLLEGAINKEMVHKKYFFSDNDNRYKVLLGESMFSLAVVLFTILVFSCMEYFIRTRSFLFFPMLMSAFAFFLPSLISSAFDAAYAIPESEFHLWSYPPDDIIYPYRPNQEKILYAFKLSIQATDKEEVELVAKESDLMELGDFFYHFIRDYEQAVKVKNDGSPPIEIRNDDNEVYQWWFRRKSKWYQRQVVYDPRLSLIKNRLKKNTVIICERFEIN